MGELARRAEAAWELLRGCTVCPQNCPIDRTAGAGARVTRPPISSSAHGTCTGVRSHPSAARGGAGTIFFGGCQARCSYCQNFWLSQQGNGLRVGPERLAEMMLSLQRKGCHNIDLVTPTHFVPADSQGAGDRRRQRAAHPDGL